MTRDVLVFSLTLLVLIGVGACIEPIAVSDYRDPQPDPLVIVSVSATEHDGNVPENTLDGDLSTRWSAQGKGQYIVFEFNKTSRLRSVDIAWFLGDERYSTYEIFTSLDGVAWVSRVSRTTEELTLDHQSDPIDADARFVRIVGYGNSQSSWNSITSVRFDGAQPSYEQAIDPRPADRTLGFRGDPNFDPAQLTSEQRAFYERFIEEIDDPENKAGIDAFIARDDSFFYGRMLQGHVQAVLTVFMLTGDLELLDYADSITESMRENLDYGWRDTRDGTDGTDSEYLMWVYRSSSASGYNDENDGKDRRIDDVKVNALIAMVATALDENRDLASPSGRDYGAHADFWKEYLTNHFEAKWRDRSNKPTGHPITTPHPDAHSYWSWIKLSYFMGVLTGDQGWSNEAIRTADVVWDHEIRDVADYGEDFSAYVWMSNIAHQSTNRNYLQSSSYASSNYADVVMFHFVGFHDWADEQRMSSFARSIEHYQFRKADGSLYSSPSDVFSHGIAGDIGGNSPGYKVSRAGIPPDPRDDRPLRRSADVFAGHESSLLAPWDASGQIAAVGAAYQDRYPSKDTTTIAAAHFMRSYLVE